MSDNNGVAKTPGLMVRFFRGTKKWLREMRSELKKVVWPTRKQVIHNSIIVLVMVIVIGAFIALLDFCTGFGVKSLIQYL